MSDPEEGPPGAWAAVIIVGSLLVMGGFCLAFTWIVTGVWR